MWASSGPEREAMIKKLVLAALPVAIGRYKAGTGMRTLATMYGCDPLWLRDQFSKEGVRLRSLQEVSVARELKPVPWTPVPMPGKKLMP
ncbi:hypothetical protein OG455_39295 [Kitasatospora sp. NBC_01287]|uniref:hypothetical protein n=1 Tax=Kitasatospora sp. NBC_01287 TaxID=2903573 RepID=UPI00225B9D78|nr:hypothetical protein [Kitasatospora sp. NBC_01287]MCX4751483.1 hypothetical protein [Kitasatospora sp. NBC_01287]